jgi:hypothetical protein
MNTCTLKQENSNLIWKRGMPDLLFPSSYWQMHSLSSHLFDCLVRDLNYEPWPVTTACINIWKTYHVRLHVQYSFPEDEHKTLETCRRQED